ncbi:MAG TPA: hypothetical protein VN176_13185 [Verrucomicrobiae bacterium]|jgi:hypothetical protein|nr:hypothetical protein [Verrucomicrobiae bacterium]
MQFSEANGPWRAIPGWVDFLIKSGSAWGDTIPNGRRIGLISMPCESAAAGLVALGAMRHRLAIDGANDSLSHFRRIEQLATRRDVETFLRHDSYRGRFRLESKDQSGLLWVRTETVRMAILPSNVHGWTLDGEAPVQASQGAELPHRDFYEELMHDAGKPILSNFGHSDSGTCLAGRVAGESVSKSLFAGVRFQCRDYVADLSCLLTIQDWSPGTISRVAFFNARTGRLDRNTGLTRLVVADGHSAFLKVIEAAEFRNSNVVGVIHRAVDRDKLEAIGVKIENLAQWYAADNDMQERIQPAPTGITTLALRRR